MLTAEYMAERAVWGSEATRGPHAMVIAFHVGSTLFVALLAAAALRGLRYRWWGAAAAGALFAAHPIHTESVCWITGRTDTLATLFLLPSLLLALVYRDRRSTLAIWASPVLFLAAALTKEAALAGLGLLPICLALVPTPDAKNSTDGAAKTPAAPRSRGWFLGTLFTLAALVYLILRIAAGSQSGASGLISRQPLELLGRLGAAFAYYSIKAVAPAPQSALVTELPGTVPSMVALLAAAAFAVFAWRRASAGQGIWLLCVLWFGVTLLPSLPVAILRVAETPVAERYLYLPSVGLCFFFGALLAEGLNRTSQRQLVLGLAAVVILVASVATVRRSAVWKNDLVLWSDTVDKEPSSGLAWSELGKAYLDRGEDLTRALAAYEKAVRHENDAQGRAIAYNAMGVIQARRGNEEEALESWTAATREEPSYASAWYNLGNLKARRFETMIRQESRLDLDLLAEARSHLEHAVEHDPRYLKGWLRLIWCDVQEVVYPLASHGNVEVARAAMTRAVENRDRLAQLDPGGELTQQAGRLLRQAEGALRSFEGQEGR